MWVTVIGIVGSVASILSITVAVIQTYRHKAAQEALREVRRSRSASIWTNINFIIQAFDSVENALSSDFDATSIDKVQAKFMSVRRAIVDCYLELLREASLDEPVFNEETVKRWRRIGKLENDWREQQARRLIYHGDYVEQSDAGPKTR